MTKDEVTLSFFIESSNILQASHCRKVEKTERQNKKKAPLKSGA